MKVHVPLRELEAVMALALIFAGVWLWLSLPIALVVLGVLVLADVVTTR